ncbi:MAG TPA: right-handed parallel beta-helix repeat-containing protein [Polyangia bacterium]|nr:right-handed parallel beta-helix repeat-containing protein [Polyangia bacterium]
MSKPRLAAATAFLALAISAGRAAATAYVVAPTGDDSAAGSSAAPWRTLQKAAGKVMAGDTVTVRDGTYAGFACNGRSGTATARIVFTAENKGGPKITSPGVGADDQDFIQLASCSYVTIDGFEVSGAPRSGIAILGNANDGSDARGVVIQNNHSHHNGGPVAHGRHDGIFSGFALDLTIQNNEVHDNSEHGIYVSNAADNPIIRRNHAHDVGVNCVQINADLSTGGDGLISGWLIEDNVVHGCGSAGFNLDGAIRGVMQNNLAYDCAKGGVTLFQGDGAQASHDNLIVNNTIYNPGGSRAALQVANGANNNVVFNNILYAQAIGLEIQTVTGLVHDYNFVSSYAGGVAAAHETTAAPALLFMNVPARNLSLAPASPAVGSGVATLGGKAAPAVDIEGNERPAAGAPDRGCFEGSTNGLGLTIGEGPSSGGTDAGTGTGRATGGGAVTSSDAATMTSTPPGTSSSPGSGGGATGTGGAAAGAAAGTSELTGCACRASKPGAPGSWAALGVMVLAFARRRRRGQP